MGLSPAQQQALNTLGWWLAGGASLGISARLASSLLGVGQRAITPKPPGSPRSVVIDIPYKRRNRLEDKRPEDAMLETDKEEKAEKAAKIDFHPLFTGSNQWEIPLMLPALVTGTPLAAMGGYSLVDAILRARRKAYAKEDLEDARNEYRKTMIKQLKPVEEKASSFEADLSGDSEIGKLLDQCAENVQAFSKEAIMGIPLMGVYLTIASILAGGAGSLTYNYARKTSPERIKAEEIKSKLEEHGMPSPHTYVRLVPTDDDEEEKKKSKLPMLPKIGSYNADKFRNRAKKFVHTLLTTKA